MSVLVTGGAGYIGSHTVIQLLDAGYEVVVADNFVNAKPEVLRRIERITGKKFKFYEADLCDFAKSEQIFKNETIDSVIHFAALKAVGESVQLPFEYYQNNLGSTLNLIGLMKKYNVRNLVFSSSATVYGQPKSVPIDENFDLSATNPYGQTKLMIEQMLKDIAHADPTLNIALLRYFNPIGAHKSGLIGEDPNGIPNNLVPYIAQVAVGKLKKVNVFGGDYPTKDGTGVRDYIHVCDLAEGHLLALKKLDQNCGLVIYNLGTGTGYSVLEIIAAFSKACGIEIPFEITARRPGDIAECYANPEKAWKEIGFKARFGLSEMCEDGWRWQKNNPNGYDS